MSPALPPDPDAAETLDSTGLLLRVGLFVSLALLCRLVLPFVLFALPLPQDASLLVRSVLSSFLTGLLASYLTARRFAPLAPDTFESGTASFLRRALGFGGSVSRGLRQMAIGLAAGAAAASAIILLPLAFGWAALTTLPVDAAASTAHQAQIALLPGLVLLLLGAAGEEMLFHGYAFQALVGQHGALPPSPLRPFVPWLAILAFGLVFGWAHWAGNQAPPLAVYNTIGWGVLLGYVAWRTGALWMSAGLHFGWNVIFPLFGVNLSGITIGLEHSGPARSLQWNVGDLWSGGAYGPEGGLLTSLAVALLPLLLGAVASRDLQAGGRG